MVEWLNELFDGSMVGVAMIVAFQQLSNLTIEQFSSDLFPGRELIGIG